MSIYKRPLTPADLPASIPYCADLSGLAREMTVGGKTIPNRICYQPMEGCDGEHDGTPGALTVRRYRKYAQGGPGLIWFEATAILEEGKANPHQMLLYEGNLSAYAELVAQIKSICLQENGYEPIILCQLTHSGRWSKPHGVPAPRIAYRKPIFESAGPLPDSAVVSDAELEAMAEHYAHTALLCQKAGFDGVDVKACHGYLLSELLNAYLRPGRYGGSYENRTRLYFDAIRAVKAACRSNFLLGSRFNAYDGYPYPYGIGDSGEMGVPDWSEARQIAADLRRLGVSLLNVTMGCPYTNPEVNRPTTLAKQEPPYRSIERMLQGAQAVKEAAEEVEDGAAVIASAMTYLGTLAPHVAAAGIESGAYHLAGFGRGNFADPWLAKDILTKGGMDTGKSCLTCGKCTELMRGGQVTGCVIHDQEQYLPIYRQLQQTLAAKR